MNTIPEVPKGKELIWAEAVYKEPIEGVPFSNAGMSLFLVSLSVEIS